MKQRKKHSEMTNTLLRLFKLVFHSIVMFADNELVLQPYLAVIVKTGIKSAMSAKRPDNFLLLIRALFRRVAAGKFELCTRVCTSFTWYVPFSSLSLQHTSPTNTNTNRHTGALLRLQSQVESQTTADMLVELCLIIPAPLSSLLQHLSLLLQPVILALRSRDELAHLGLQTSSSGSIA